MDSADGRRAGGFADVPGAARADFADGTIKIGVLTDLSGPYEGNGGHGSVAGAQIAADEFGGKIDGAKIVIISADHQNKPDIGAVHRQPLVRGRSCRRRHRPGQFRRSRARC